MDCVSQFHQTLEAAFGPLNWSPVPDGKIHRFSSPGEGAGSPHNWYWLSRRGHEGCFASVRAAAALGSAGAGSIPERAAVAASRKVVR